MHGRRATACALTLLTLAAGAWALNWVFGRLEQSVWSRFGPQETYTAYIIDFCDPAGAYTIGGSISGRIVHSPGATIPGKTTLGVVGIHLRSDSVYRLVLRAVVYDDRRFPGRDAIEARMPTIKWRQVTVEQVQTWFEEVAPSSDAAARHAAADELVRFLQYQAVVPKVWSGQKGGLLVISDPSPTTFFQATSPHRELPRVSIAAKIAWLTAVLLWLWRWGRIRQCHSWYDHLAGSRLPRKPAP